MRDANLRLKWYMPIDINTPVAISISGDDDCDLRQYLRYNLLKAGSYFDISPQTSDAHPLSSRSCIRPLSISMPVHIIRMPSRIILVLFVSSIWSMWRRISYCMSSSESSNVYSFDNCTPCIFSREMSINTFCFSCTRVVSSRRALTSGRIRFDVCDMYSSKRLEKGARSAVRCARDVSVPGRREFARELIVLSTSVCRSSSSDGGVGGGLVPESLGGRRTERVRLCAALTSLCRRTWLATPLTSLVGRTRL